MDRKALQQMLDRGIDNPLLRYTLGTLCLKDGSLDEAVLHLEAALDQDPNHSASWKSYAKALTGLGQLHQAREAYEKGIVVANSKGDIQAVKEMKVFLARLS